MILRILIAFIFIPLFVGLVLLERTIFYNVLITLALLTALLEYSGMFKKAGIKIFTFINILFLAAVLFGLARFRVYELNILVLYRGFTLIIVYAVFLTVFSLFSSDIKEGVLRLVFSFFGGFYVVLLGSSLILLRNLGPFHTLFLFAVVWLYDGGAYFIGSKYGKTKITPLISPNKSLEGLIGGVITALAAITALKYISFTSALVPYNDLGHIYIIVIFLCLAAQSGDLLESLLKRFCGVKDSSNLVLAHGGVLDKMDSFLLAVPIYLLLAVL